MSGWRHTFISLANPDFRNMWLGMLAAMGGFQMGNVAMGYLVYDLTSSPSLLGVVYAGESIPLLVFALFGGAIADRMDRKRVIQLGQGSLGIIALLIAISISTGTVTWVHLLVAAIAHGALFSFMMPARHAMIPQLVGRELLTNAMALNASVMTVALLVSPAVAGGLYGLIGPDGVYYTVAALGLIAVLLTRVVASPPLPTVKVGSNVLGDIRAGITHIWHNPLVKTLLFLALVTTLVSMPFRFLLPVFVVDVYEKGPEAFGLLVSSMGLGSLFGGLFIAALGKWRRGMLVMLGGLASGIALLVVAVVPIYLVAAILMVLLGLGDTGRRALTQALIMEHSDDEYRGRVMSVFLMNFGLTFVGVLPAGIAIDFFGGQWVIGFMAIVLLAISVSVLITQRNIRELP